MRTKLLSFLTFTFLCFAISFAQDTFDQKKHDQKAGASTANQQAKFNFQNIKPKTNKTIVPTSKTNFQLPSVFNYARINSEYIHTSIKNFNNGKSLFIESIVTDAAKKTIAKLDDEAIAKNYLKEITSQFQINTELNDFKLVQSNTDDLGQSHLKMQHTFKGIKVYGSEVIVHLDKKNGKIGANGSQINNLVLDDVLPKIDKTTALELIEKDLGKKLPKALANQGFNIIPEPFDEIIFYPTNEQTLLTYHLTIYANLKDRWEYFIDAKTGEIIDKYYHTCSFVHDLNLLKHEDEVPTTYSPPSLGSGKDLRGVTRQINTFNLNGQNYLLNTTKAMFNSAQSGLPDNPVGGILTLDLKNKPLTDNVQIFHVTNANNSWNNPTAISAHYNADVAFEYFKNTFGRNSINGQGGTILSFINVADTDGSSMDNAYWNGAAMFYGNGNVAFTPLAGSLDVGGHEMSHGVIQNTANLEYRNQSGAMNESFADVFGVLIDRDDWTLGEDVAKTQYYPSGALRSMQNPNNGGSTGAYNWQPKDMSEYVTTQQDNGGVHINSGIPNRAFYLFATAIGKDKAEKVYYRTLTTYLTASSQFTDLRLGVIKSATDLYGATSPEVQAAKNAFDTVGITDGAPTNTDNPIPTATGSDFILSVDVDPNNANTLYVSDTNGQNFVALTTTKLGNKPSVADDGSLAIFVTEDKTINAISLDVNNIEEFIISDQPIWSSVSISKDGNKIAAVRTDVDGVIIIFDLVNSTSKTFNLYNPTTANGITTGEVLYADALEWDYSGQYLIYDALNAIKNSNGSTINYWDVGAMEVWNNQSNSFGLGTIQKIFTNLPEGVSIGNPSFSKTSGNILAFDYFDDTDNSYEIITANIETGQVKLVYQNNKLGFPNYSKSDTKLLFDTNNGTNEDIAIINIAADKLSPQGNPSILIPDGIWGIWYTVGNRTTVSSAKDITDFRFTSTNPVSVGVINGNAISIQVPSATNRQSLIATFTSSEKSQIYIGNTLQQSGVNTNNFTNPLSYKVIAEDGTTKIYTVTVTNTVDTNDSDSDGVPNANDQCPNTPIGTVVDTNGCPKFSLPANNFQISATGETCIESNNGSIAISSIQSLSYTAVLTGNGINQTQQFTTNYTFNNLPGGTYNLCFTVQGQNGYKLCYDVVVNKPASLSVTGKLDNSTKSITLKMNGAEVYYVTINNALFTTTDSEINLNLNSDINKIVVRTDKECQGVYEEDFILNDQIVIYPNPVTDGNLNIYLPNTDQLKAIIQLSTLAGQTILIKQVDINNGVATINTSQLHVGVYLLYVTIDNSTTTNKIIIK